MGYTVIAPLGDNPNALFIGMREFPTKKVILISPKTRLTEAEGIRKKLKPFGVEVEVHKIEQGLMESMFAHVGNICSSHEEADLIVNVATGDRLSTCAALSAAFANGLKAFGVMNGEPVMLPIMHLSYYDSLTASKRKIIQELNEEDYQSLSDIAKKLKMSPSLLSYHIHGTLKNKGLEALRLVEIKNETKQISIKRSQLASLLLKGYINQ